MPMETSAALAESLLELVDRQPGFRTLGPHVDLLQKELRKAVRSYRRAEKGGSREATAAAAAGGGGGGCWGGGERGGSREAMAAAAAEVEAGLKALLEQTVSTLTTGSVRI